MMMPANFTAVNSEVVYGGADLLSILADTTAPAKIGFNDGVMGITTNGTLGV